MTLTFVQRSADIYTCSRFLMWPKNVWPIRLCSGGHDLTARGQVCVRVIFLELNGVVIKSRVLMQLTDHLVLGIDGISWSMIGYTYNGLMSFDRLYNWFTNLSYLFKFVKVKVRADEVSLKLIIKSISDTGYYYLQCSAVNVEHNKYKMLKSLSRSSIMVFLIDQL